jgi:hypothetical protein
MIYLNQKSKSLFIMTRPSPMKRCGFYAPSSLIKVVIIDSSLPADKQAKANVTELAPKPKPKPKPNPIDPSNF